MYSFQVFFSGILARNSTFVVYGMSILTLCILRIVTINLLIHPPTKLAVKLYMITLSGICQLFYQGSKKTVFKCLGF